MDASLDVDRGELEAGIKTLRRTTDSDQRGEAVFEFEDDQLLIHCGGVTVRAQAHGNWPGRARLASSVLMGAGRGLPPDDPLTLAVEDGTLYIGTLKLSCTWDSTGRPLIELPMNPNWTTLLQISRHYDQKTIEGSGITELITEAEERLNDKIDSATRKLESLGVTREDLEQLVEEKLAGEEEPDALIGPDQQRLPLRLDGDQLILGDD